VKSKQLLRIKNPEFNFYKRIDDEHLISEEGIVLKNKDPLVSVGGRVEINGKKYFVKQLIKKYWRKDDGL